MAIQRAPHSHCEGRNLLTRGAGKYHLERSTIARPLYWDGPMPRPLITALAKVIGHRDLGQHASDTDRTKVVQLASPVNKGWPLYIALDGALTMLYRVV